MILAQTKTPLCRLGAQADPNIMHSFYEFFAGGGMARVGLGPVNFRCAFANDFDHQKGQSYRANFGDDLKIADVASLTLADLPGTPDLVCPRRPVRTSRSLATARDWTARAAAPSGRGCG
jgi:hypothetical protein